MWWTRGGEYLGRVRLNLRLNDELREFGGHIGYDVRPSARARGHASAMLAAALTRAAAHGLEDVLLTCAPDNVPSRRVIERNGGELLGLSTAGRLLFRCATAPTGVHAGPEHPRIQ
jgi:predicted acetyltransferase